MNIDLSALSYDQLVELNHKIVERLKLLDAHAVHEEMMQFSAGDKVCFEAPGRGKLFGTIVKLNRKTVTINTESGQSWKVSPHVLSKVKEVKPGNGKKGNVIELNPV